MTGNYLDTMDGFVRRFQAAKILPEGDAEELFHRYAHVVRVYPRSDSDLVSCHNDLKPQNIRFDGDQLWLIDWEAAFLNDRYVDLAVFANFFISDDREQEYLSAYFGGPVGDYRRARFYLMRQAVHMFYAAFLMLLAARSGSPFDPDVLAPDFKDFHRRLVTGEISLATDEEKLQYAKVHLNEALRNMRTPRFDAALIQVGGFEA